MRIGQGIDIHRFAQTGDHIVIGGVFIPYHKSLIAHSDGDVLLHAICDSLLGAAALGDIGHHFPDSSAEFCGVDSRLLLRKSWQLVQDLGLNFANLDATIVAESPKMADYIMQMRKNIAADLVCDVSQINIKATTSEKVGFIGRGEAIAAFANVLLTTKS